MNAKWEANLKVKSSGVTNLFGTRSCKDPAAGHAEATAARALVFVPLGLQLQSEKNASHLESRSSRFHLEGLNGRTPGAC